MASPVRVEAITGLRRSPAHRQTGEDVVEPDGGRLRVAGRRVAVDGAGVAAGRTGQLEERFAVAGPGDLRTATARGVDGPQDRKSTRLNSSHSQISYAVFCLTKKK